MKLPFRFVVPVLLAIVCAGALVVLLWWQLVQSATILKDSGRITETGTGSTLAFTPSPIDPRDRALLALRQGDLLALRGEWVAAETEYESAVEAGGGLPALRKLAQAKLQRHDIDGVRAVMKKMQSAGARDEDLLLLQSIVDLRTGELVQARNRLVLAPESPQRHYGLALLALIEGNHDTAQTELQEVINGWEPSLRANARTIQAAYDEYNLFPESPDIHLVTLLSRALAQVQECPLALPLLNQVTLTQGEYRDAWIVQGYCELTTERYEQALASLERAYALDPQKPEIQYFLARTYAALNDHENAITFYEYALVNGFDPAEEVRRWIARSALASNNGVLALQQYELLAGEEDATIEPYEGYVATSIALKQPEGAYLFAQKAVERWPEDAKAHELLGWAAAESARTEEARFELKKAVEMDPYLLSAQERLEKL